MKKLLLALSLITFIYADSATSINNGMEESVLADAKAKEKSDELDLIVLKAPQELKKLRKLGKETIVALENSLTIIKKIESDPMYRDCRVAKTTIQSLERDLEKISKYQKSGKLSSNEAATAKQRAADAIAKLKKTTNSKCKEK